MRCAPETTWRLACVLLAGAGPLLGPGPAARADLPGYRIEKLAAEGDPDPRGGTLHTITSEVAIADGRVAFWGYAGAGPDTLYVVRDGVIAVAVAAGDPAPGTGGSLLTDVGRPRLAGPDALAYVGSYAGVSGAFLRSGGTDAALALPGDAAPGGGTIADVGWIHAGAPGPWVAFGGSVDTGLPDPVAAHFVHGPGGLREVYREGQAAPAGVGGVFSGVQPFQNADVGDDGAVTFNAAVSGGSAASGLFRSSPAGVIAPLLLEGDAVATPGGGTFAGFLGLASVNGAGDVAFDADVLRPPAPLPQEGVFVLEGGVLREVAIRGDAIPGASPAAPYFAGLLGSSPPELSDAGLVAFTASFEDAALTTSDVAVVVDDGSGPVVLVRKGDPVPGIPGATFRDFVEARVDASGRIAIQASTDQGAGVFLATPSAGIPALPTPGLLALAAVLAASGRRCGSRERWHRGGKR